MILFIPAGINLMLHIFTNLTGGYGIFRDEYYYIDCSDHLAFGYVDHPPLSIIILKISRFLFGDSLFAIRLLPAIAGAVIVFLTGMIVKEMGGRKFAQILAALAVALIPGYLGMHNYFSMNVFEHLLWTIAVYLIIRIINTGDSRLWLWFGLVAGLGMQNKISMIFFGFGLAVAMIFTPERRYYKDKFFWIGGLIAVVIFLPHILWQVANGWPTLEFIENAKQGKITAFSSLGFFATQIVDLNPIFFPLWFGGLIYLLAGRGTRPYRLAGLLYVLIFALLALQRSKPYYLWAIYPVLFAAGAIGWERLIARWRDGWIKVVSIMIVAVFGILILPMALPLLPVESFMAYSNFIGLEHQSGESHDLGALPQYFADMHGWENLANVVADVYHSLPPGEKSRSAIFAGNFGEAGAINYYRERYDLPPALSGHNAHWHWGPPDIDPEVIIGVGVSRKGLESVFEEVIEAAIINCDYCMPYEDGLPVFICRKPKISLKDVWPDVKHYG
jgi:hypothetical protein